jgi:3-hydroxybutyryl-CoA dehydrogenase
VAALAGPDVRLIDVSAEQLQRALSTIRRNLDRQVTRGTVAAAAVEPALARISHGTDLAAAGDAD